MPRMAMIAAGRSQDAAISQDKGCISRVLRPIDLSETATFALWSLLVARYVLDIVESPLELGWPPERIIAAITLDRWPSS